MCAWRNSGNSSTDSAACTAERRALSLLLEGAAINQVQIELPTFQRFRSAILRDSIRLAEPQPEADLLQTVAAIVREFDKYRSASEIALEARQKEWRMTTNLLMHQLADHYQIDRRSELWTGIELSLNDAASSDEIQALRCTLLKIFQSGSEATALRIDGQHEEQDRSVANDNAAGLRGGGAAIEHVRSMLAGSRPGYIGLFRFSCLDVVGERFGPEGIQDCLMAVSAFLIENLRAEDIVYHWSESSLLAVCDRKVREDILSAELNRVLARNRDFTIQIGDRTIMLRIPIELQLFPITMFASADELQNLAGNRGRGDRALSDRAVTRLSS
jgi:GGDEF domain-containing protein